MLPAQWILLVISPIVVLTVAAAPVDAQIESREAELKGKLVGVLGKLVTWPTPSAPTSRNPLTIGILGTNPFVGDDGVNHLQKKVGRTATINYYAKPDDIKECHILVIARDAEFQAALEKVKATPTLVVGESPNLAKQGAAMNLVFDQAQNKIRLEINPRTAGGAGLRINPGLLNSPTVDIIR